MKTHLNTSHTRASIYFHQLQHIFMLQRRSQNKKNFHGYLQKNKTDKYPHRNISRSRKSPSDLARKKDYPNPGNNFPCIPYIHLKFYDILCNWARLCFICIINRWLSNNSSLNILSTVKIDFEGFQSILNRLRLFLDNYWCHSIIDRVCFLLPQKHEIHRNHCKSN